MKKITMVNRKTIWKKLNPEKHKSNKKIYKIRKQLRDIGALPPPNTQMTDEQLKIFTDVGNGDFTYWNSIKKNTTNSGGNQLKRSNVLLEDELNYINEKKRIKEYFKSIEYKIYNRARSNASKRKMEFNIDHDDIIIPEYCPYLGIKIETIYNIENDDYYFSIDRIDSTKGYVKGNVQVISKLANVMKNHASTEQLISFANGVLRVHSS